MVSRVQLPRSTARAPILLVFSSSCSSSAPPPHSSPYLQSPYPGSISQAACHVIQRELYIYCTFVSMRFLPTCVLENVLIYVTGALECLHTPAANFRLSRFILKVKGMLVMFSSCSS